MIKPITREYFYKQIGVVNEWRKTLGFRLNNFLKDRDYVGETTALYFEKPGEGYFVYIPDFKFIAIPNKYESLEISPDEIIYYKDWEFEETGSGHNEEYTFNLYFRTAGRYQDISDEFYSSFSSKYPQREEISLINERIGYAKKVELMYRETSWSKGIYLAYPEKIDLPYDGRKLRGMDIEIKNIMLWSQKKH